MRITGLRTESVALPVERRVVSRVRDTAEVLYVLVWLDTSDGLTGCSYVAAFTPGGARSVRALLADLGGLLVGSPVEDQPAVLESLWRETRLLGHGGLATFAVSAIDMAWWDVAARRAGKPLCDLLGKQRATVPAYASGGLWLASHATLVEDAEAFLAEGFRAMKLRVGRADPAEDLAAARLVRRTVGDEITLFADANQGLTVAAAIELGRALAAEAGIAWLEEPVAADDLEGHAAVAAALDIPVASGENRYRPSGVAALAAAHAADILMPDLQRVGGISGWGEMVGIAAHYDLPLTPHLFPEIGVHLAAAATQVPWVEWMPWTAILLTEPPIPRDGLLTVPSRPGVGLDFSPEAVRRYRFD